MSHPGKLGYVRVAAATPPVALANPAANAEVLRRWLDAARAAEASLCLFPELCLTGFTCEDLFFGQGLLAEAREGVVAVARECRQIVAVVGAPYALPDGRLLNVSFVLAHGGVVGAVPKSVLPTYGEFYDQRWFTAGAGVAVEVDDPVLGRFPLSDRLVFDAVSHRFALEVCEDLWAPEPVGARHAVAGAELILNPSASNELVGKAAYRADLVRMASGARLCAYLYASSGPLESTKDVVFGGDLIAAENGVLLGRSEPFRLDGASLFVDFDVASLRRDRRYNQSFNDAPRPADYRTVPIGAPRAHALLERRYDRHPFVPRDSERLDARAREILAIQATGLARRMRAVGTPDLLLGVSGGLDSTWAFVVCLDALDRLGEPHARLQAVTMPGPGTSDRTRELARRLAASAHVALREIDIAPAVAQHLADLDHEATDDVTFENAQARERTQLLFNLANKHNGLVVGTGDLSELALGWCTYNADHMAGYAVNAGVPKTLIRYLVRWYADHHAGDALAAVLRAVLDLPVSPELLPRGEGEIVQQTELVIGPYELHDFFLYHYVRQGWRFQKIFAIACRSFAGDYEPEEIRGWLRIFCQRFHRQQFKRTTLPPGPKVGTVTLSPRGDWRMPDEVDIRAMLEEIDRASVLR